MTLYISAKQTLDSFLRKGIKNYTKSRNFDFGTENRGNVSRLSPFISHRLILEYDVIKNALALYPFEKIEKFIEEIFWGVYWRGWLEQRPSVWESFRNYPEPLKSDPAYARAVNGGTGIDCFDHWVEELKTDNYLHNHARMWFASIWVFTLKLPWQWGARFFLEHLLDGSSASNTLSWRWVAGIQTKGKTYLARPSNIHKYSAMRFLPEGLAEYAPPIEDDTFHSISPLPSEQTIKKTSNTLIVCDTDLCFQDRGSLFESYEKILVLSLENESREVKLASNVSNFKKNALLDFSQKFENASILKSTNFMNGIGNTKKFDVVYPFIGESLDFLTGIETAGDLQLSYLVREEDLFAWQFAKKGFFNFKKNIKQIVSQL